MPHNLYRRLVEMIGNPKVTIPLGLIEVEQLREIVHSLPAHNGSNTHNPGTELVTRLLHRINTAYTIDSNIDPDSIQIPITTDELHVIRECITAVADPQPQHTLLLEQLERRQNGRARTDGLGSHDPGE